MAGTEVDCAESEGCLEYGDCHYNAVTRKCDDGTRRVNDNMFWNGVAVVIAGGTSTAVGAGLLVSLFLEELSCAWSGERCPGGWRREAWIYSGEVLVIGGPVIMLGIGVPLAVFGGQRLPREPRTTSVRVEIGPSGAALGASF